MTQHSVVLSFRGTWTGWKNGQRGNSQSSGKEMPTFVYGKKQLHSPIHAEAGKHLGREGPRGPAGPQDEHEAVKKARCILSVASKAPVQPHPEYGIWGLMVKEKDGLAGVGPVKNHGNDQRTRVSFMP